MKTPIKPDVILFVVFLLILTLLTTYGNSQAHGLVTPPTSATKSSAVSIAMVKLFAPHNALLDLTLTPEFDTPTATVQGQADTPTNTPELPTDTPTTIPTDTPTDIPTVPTDTPTAITVPTVPTDTPTSPPAPTPKATERREADATPTQLQFVVTPEPWGSPVFETPGPTEPVPSTFTPPAGTPAAATPLPTPPTPGTFTPTSINVIPPQAMPTPHALSTFTPKQDLGGGATVSPPVASPTIAVVGTFTPTPIGATQPSCSGRFIPHDLPHVTTLETNTGPLPIANGAGVAINDLDNDGDLDIVLGGNDGADTLLWNESNLTFRWNGFGTGRTRTANIVDVDGDGWQDIVLTKQTGALDYWRNLGSTVALDTVWSNKQFTLETLPGITQPATAIDWADLDNDGDLDLVAAAYTVNLSSSVTSGIYAYTNQDVTFTATALATTTLALALTLFDINNDSQLDILVGNDSALPDQAWMHQSSAWLAATPFARTGYSTRSFAWADVDNNGVYELFATDMKPYTTDAATLAAWQPVLLALEESTATDDRQLLGNVLQMGNGVQVYTNRAVAWGVDATGWSWSGQLGDFDNDGYLDLYVVNGMIDQAALEHLPNQELVEENQAFHNIGGARFALAPDWGLNATRSGRGMVIADLDTDGDLDIIVNNLGSPAQLFENQLCRGDSLEVDLQWLQSRNRHGIGAQLVLHTPDATYYRHVHVAGGYLSGNPSRVHFGFPTGVQPDLLEVHWPDGVVTRIARPEPNTVITVER